MEEQSNDKPAKAPKKVIDWELIERHYRAGIKTLRQIGNEYGCSHVAIQRKAEKFGWVRDLTEKIAQKTHEKVTKAEVTKARYREASVTTPALLTDAAVVQEYSEIAATVEMKQRTDLDIAIDTNRKLGVLLSDMIDNIGSLAELGEMMRNPNESGMDRLNDKYMAIISLPELIKAHKDNSTALVTLGAQQRKAWRLDIDKGPSGMGSYEDTLRAAANAAVQS